MGLFKWAQDALFAKPSPEKQLAKLLTGRAIRRIVELGIDSLDATATLLAATVKGSAGQAVRYTAIDPFDERSADREPLSLVPTYRRLTSTGSSVRLIPGGVLAGLSAQANALADTDLVLLSAAETDGAIGRGWFYLPRMCHPGTLVVRRNGADARPEDAWEVISLERVAANAAPSFRRAA